MSGVKWGTCESCAYFRVGHTSRHEGRCMLLPPVHVSDEVPGQRPKVFPSDFCASYSTARPTK